MNRMPKRLLWGVLPVLVVGVALAVAGVPGSPAAESDAGRLERLGSPQPVAGPAQADAVARAMSPRLPARTIHTTLPWLSPP